MTAPQTPADTGDPQHKNQPFARKKADILADLSKPEAAYTDLSPKGSVDIEIRELVDVINSMPECVTTSSCAGRISVFLESYSKGRRYGMTKDSAGPSQSSSIKGNGGRWLFVSHQPVDLKDDLDLHQRYGLARQSAEALNTERYVHFKFEPMILHILVASPQVANAILASAQQAGFRESGISGVLSSHPMVAVRSTGLALESIIGAAHDLPTTGEQDIQAIVSEGYLRMMTNLANQRFEQNSNRIMRFWQNFDEHFRDKGIHILTDMAETREERRLRKRAEGLQRQEMMHGQGASKR